MVANSLEQRSASVELEIQSLLLQHLSTLNSVEVKKKLGKCGSECLGHNKTRRVDVHLLLNQHSVFWGWFLLHVIRKQNLISDQQYKLEQSRARLFIDFLFDYEWTKNEELFKNLLKCYWKGSRNGKH